MQDAPNVRNLNAQFVRHLRPVRFIFGEALRTKCWLRAFEDRRDVIRLEFCDQAPHHVVKDKNSLCRETCTRAHGRRTAAGARVVRTKDEPERVDQKQPRNWHFFQDRRGTPLVSSTSHSDTCFDAADR
jgi:hypothetical protein